MPKFRVRQLRSGEGAILTQLSNLSVSELPMVRPELFENGVLLVAGEGLPAAGPPGAEGVADGLWVLRGDDASRFVSESHPEGRGRLMWAVLDERPSAERLTRCAPDALRAWDHERLEASVYAQSGEGYAQQGVWFRDEEERRRWLEAAVSRLLDAADRELPTGDATIVLELPTDSTFEATYTLRGKGAAFRIKRDFGNHGFLREWRIERGEWMGEETRRAKRDNAPLAQRITQSLATLGILVLSLPVGLFVACALLTTKLTSGSDSSSKVIERL